nr:MAG TPA: hypothetical protein [Caudoviricetes sp.]
MITANKMSPILSLKAKYTGIQYYSIVKSWEFRRNRQKIK